MWLIKDNVFLGQDTDAKNLSALQAAGVTHILNCAVELSCYHPTEFTYFHLPLRDPDVTFGAIIPSACEFLDNALQSGRALVHCRGALSRSPSIILAYLCHQGLKLPDAAGP